MEEPQLVPVLVSTESSNSRLERAFASQVIFQRMEKPTTIPPKIASLSLLMYVLSTKLLTSTETA